MTTDSSPPTLPPTSIRPPNLHDSMPAQAPGSRLTVLIGGVVLGVAVTAAAFALVLKKMETAPPPPVSSYHVEADLVRLTGEVPMRFDTAPVIKGAPLPFPPVTARVATIESRTAPSFAPLDGRVSEVAVRIGDMVKQGDRLMLVKSGDLATMQRELAAARLSIRTKEALADRLRMLVESRAASKNDLLVAEGELNEAKLTATAANAKLRSLSVSEAGENAFWVLATRSGTVVQLDAAPGKQVGPDKDKPVATVADLEEVLVVGDVPQRDAGSLKAGMSVSIHQPGSGTEPAIGTVESISEMLDAERQTVPIRIRVLNKGHVLRPHQFVEAVFAPGANESVMQVPSEAVVSDGATSVVFVEVQPGVLRRMPVLLGRQSKEKAEIVSGVTEGQKVVVRGALLLLNAIDIKG